MSSARQPDRRDQSARNPRRNSQGRRGSDHLPRTTFTKKVFVVILVLIDALYLIGEAILSGNLHGCL